MHRLHALGLAVLLASCGGGNGADAERASQTIIPLEDGSTRTGPVDRGEGEPPLRGNELQADRKSAQALAAGGTRVSGRFLAAVSWPLMPIHTTLLPDGRVMTYGTDERGEQGGQFRYAVWDPSLGTGTDAHLLLPNTTGTDIFCSAQTVLPRTGEVIMTGGDRTINGGRNYSVADVTWYDYLNDTIRKDTQSMAQPRWYPTITTLADGSALVTGGRDDFTVTSAIATPEVYTPGSGWRSLTGANSNAAYGIDNWYYPRGWVAPDGRVFVISALTGRTFLLDATGSGSLAEQSLALQPGNYWYPGVMYAPGRILNVVRAGQVQLIDLRGSAPSATSAAPLSQDRIWANATVLADGKVFVSGGSAVENQASGVAYAGELWDPAANTWRFTGSATRMRLYHSTSMLLPDGRVLTAGGGAPGPVTNLNAEIYEPPYLFSNNTGTYAARPSITTAPLQAVWGTSFAVRMSSTAAVTRVVMVRTGSVTHSFDFDQRHIPLTFTKSGANLTVTAPAAADAPPGNYLLFVFNNSGVPSVARIVKLGPAGDEFPNSIVVRASGTLAGGTGPTISVRVAGSVVGSVEVRAGTPTDYRFPLAQVTPAGAVVEVVYTNDAVIGSENRNLVVESVGVNRATLRPTDAGVVYDRGSGNAAFDNVDVVAGTNLMDVNGALRFSATGRTSSTLVVRARGDIAEDRPPILAVRVDGVVAAAVEVRATSYTDYTLRVPTALTANSRIDLMFVNDGSVTGDRNLYIESLTYNGATRLPTDAGVTVDIGSGEAAFDGQLVIPGQSALLWNAALRFPALAPPAGPTLQVRARATLLDGVGAQMQLLVGGTSVGTVEVRSTTYADFSFTLPSAIAAGTRIDVVFGNDGGSASEDRNLYVDSITYGTTTLRPTDAGVIADLGSGAAAFDGIDTIPGQTDILWNAALRFIAPGAPPVGPTLTVRARATLLGGVGPQMQLLVGGTSVGVIEVRSTSYADFAYTLPASITPGARIDVVFGNDGGSASEDRNLYVDSIAYGTTTLRPTDAGVIVDLGTGAAAFDGIDTIAGQTDILWNAALRFVAP